MLFLGKFGRSGSGWASADSETHNKTKSKKNNYQCQPYRPLPKLDGHALVMQVCQHLGSKVDGRSSGVKLRAIAMLAVHFHPGDFDLADVVLIDVAHELSEVHL